ncbi:MAG: restriction endonuclease subunit S [Methylomonas sp.]|jgi:type I restriction enzyme S subunit|uniref:restriction endonuclease subunit S n=1 Tax=Methylomonas sp. TaxID=418 RepID=UPI0025EF93B5|nr:restriction endonuclease subunit S [Methylomonas sp.]MCK9608044.1 restriction endonuclease subunit S [Methylomonas sp.]
MSSEWQPTTLAKFADINPKRPIEKGTIAPFIEMAALPVHSRDVSFSDVSERSFSGGGSKFTNGDTLLARITPCLENGKTALISCLPLNINGHGSTEFIVLAPQIPTDRNFLYYLARSEEFRTFAISRMEGTSGRQRVPNGAVAQFSFLCPPETERKAIGELLAILDDRIYLLRETNATLEAIAQALFKSWFVDFDPVHSKQQGRIAEGMDEATAALFPDSFEQSELGLVPRGWRVTPIYELATYINGAAYKAFEPNLECRGLPIIKIAELKAGVTSQTAYSDVAMPERYRIDIGDILFSWSGNPDTSIDTFVWHHGKAWLNQHIFRVIPHAAGERSFVLQMLKKLRPTFAELARNKQTTGLGHVTVADMKCLFVIHPDKSALDLFHTIVAPIHERIFENEKQAKTLATLRDTLLPRLISGQLRLPESEIQVSMFNE